MKLIKKYISKEVRGDNKIYYRINFVYKVLGLFDYKEKIVQDEILFENLDKATQYYNIVAKPSKSLNDIFYVEKTNNRYDLNMRCIYTIYDDVIKKITPFEEPQYSRKYLFYYSLIANNAKYDGFAFFKVAGTILIDVYEGWKYDNDNIFKMLFPCNSNFIICSKVDENFVSTDALIKYIEGQLSCILGYNFTFKENAILAESQSQKRKRDIIVETEIIKIENNEYFKQINTTDDYIKRNKLIEDELKRNDDYKKLLTSLIK